MHQPAQLDVMTGLFEDQKAGTTKNDAKLISYSLHPIESANFP